MCESYRISGVTVSRDVCALAEVPSGWSGEDVLPFAILQRWKVVECESAPVWNESLDVRMFECEESDE